MPDLRTRAGIALRTRWAERLGVGWVPGWDEVDDLSRKHWLDQVDVVLGEIPPALRDVTFERATHEARGWTADHDEDHGLMHLLRLAAEYQDRGADIAVESGDIPACRMQLVKAASLLVAAIDLLDTISKEA